MKKLVFLLLSLIILSSCQLLNQGNSAYEVSVASFPVIAEKVLPSVVQVTVIDKKYQKIPEGWDFSYNPFDPSPESLKNNEKEFQDEGLGSGIVVRNEGRRYYILTNKHVIGGADHISVKISDGSLFDAEIAGIDERKDLALLYVETDKKIPVIKWGDSDSLRVGEWVMAVGSPYGYNSSVTAGIVSAVGRKNSTGGNISDFIQTDASINHGNSGGALVNLNGELIGINSWITTPTGGSIGLGFALPSNNAVKTVSDIIKYGEVRYGWIGLIGGILLESEKKYYSITAENSGVFIYQTIIGDPAYNNGIKPGDIVIAVNEKKISDVDSFTRIIGSIDSGSEMELTVKRGNVVKKIQLITDLRLNNEELLNNTAVYWPGISVISIDENNIAIFETGNLKYGVIVTNVEKIPYFSFLEAGDVIVEINGNKINNVRDFYNSLDSSLISSKEKNIIKYYRNDIEYINETE